MSLKRIKHSALKPLRVFLREKGSDYVTQGSLSFAEQTEREDTKTVDIYQCRCKECVGAVAAFVPIKEVVCARGKKMRLVAQVDRKNSNLIRKYIEEGYHGA